MRICRQHADIAIDMAVAGIGIRFNDIRSIDWKVSFTIFNAVLKDIFTYLIKVI